MTVWIVSSSVLIAVVAVLRMLLKGKIAPWLQYALWLLVLVRLLVPVSLTASRISVANLLPKQEAQAASRSVLDFDFEDLPGTAHADIQLDSPVPDAAVPAMPASAQEPAAAQKPFDWGRLLQSIWIAGALLAGLTLLGSNLTFYLRLDRSRKALNTGIPLPVYAAEGLPSPCLFGLFHPSIYVPTAYVGDEQAMAHILAHEWSHYKQGDHIWSLLRSVCVALHWYNPLVWLAAVWSKQDAELACDAAAIRRLGEPQRLPYGRTLLGLVTAKPRPADLLSCATTMRSSKRSLRQRISYIANKPKMLAVTAVCVLLAAAVAAGCTFTGAAEAQRSSQAAAEPEIAPEAETDPLWVNLSADHASICNPFLSSWPPELTAEQQQEVLDLCRYMVLTSTSNEPDWSSELLVVLSQDGETTLSFFIDAKGEIRLENEETPSGLYMCEDGASVYQHLESIYNTALEASTDPEWMGDAFLSGLRYDADSETLILPEGDYDGWTIRIMGTIPMDETTNMSYHDEFLYEEAAIDGGHSRSIALSGFNEAELELLCWDENGEVLYDGSADLMALTPSAAIPAVNLDGLSIVAPDSGIPASITYPDGTTEAIESGYIALFVNGALVPGVSAKIEDSQVLVPMEAVLETLPEGAPQPDGLPEYASLNELPAILGTDYNLAGVYYDGHDSSANYYFPGLPQVSVSSHLAQQLSLAQAAEVLRQQLIMAYEAKFGTYTPLETAPEETDDETQLRYLITNLTPVRENDRFYVFSVMEEFWVDKYTQEVYQFYNGLHMTVSRFDPQSDAALSFAG